MFELVRSTTIAHLLSHQLPVFVVSLVIAEVFYKFGSFSLECIAFLATWFAIDFAYTKILALLRKPGDPHNLT